VQGPSAIAWLDFRRDDLLRARAFLKAMEGEGVLDELGFLALQGKFADVFYPATSTLMRGARYFYFVAGIYQQLEREGLSSSQIALVARRRMDSLRDVLSKTETTGVIGRDAKLDIKQLPSSIYWGGLRQLGIFSSALSEAGYHARFDELRAQRNGYSDDDKVEQSAGGVSFWDPELPAPRFVDGAGSFRPSTNFRLTKHEAQDLSGRFVARFPESLFVHLLRTETPEIPVPWAAPRPQAKLATYLDHGKSLSLFARGTTLQYYTLVLEKRAEANLPAPDVPVAVAFHEWWGAARPVLLRWKPDNLGTLPNVADALRPGEHGDLGFIRKWLGRLAACDSASSLLGDDLARQLVRRRELDIKPAKARLKHRKHLEQWRAPDLGSNTHQLDYRHRIGSRFIREILEGNGGVE